MLQGFSRPDASDKVGTLDSMKRFEQRSGLTLRLDTCPKLGKMKSQAPYRWLTLLVSSRRGVTGAGDEGTCLPKSNV